MDAVKEEHGFVGKIPVRNLWLLLLYASDLLREIDSAKKGIDEMPDDIPILVTEMLVKRVEHRLKRSLSLSYVKEHSILNRVRGRIDTLQTERHQLLLRGKVACHFERFDSNTIVNRFVRAALSRCAGLVSSSDKVLAHRCRVLSGYMANLGVVGDCPTRSEIQSVRLTGSHSQDAKMLSLARLVFDLAIPSELAGKNSISDLERNEYVRKLFEKAVGGLYRFNLVSQGWRVLTSKQLKWQIESCSVGMQSLLPGMETDIVLENTAEQTRIVVDTKFAAMLTTGQFGQASIKSNHLYQIYAYLRSQEGSDDLSNNSCGLMLYPSIGMEFCETALIQGHQIRFATVDLTASGMKIKHQILERAIFSSDAMKSA